MVIVIGEILIDIFPDYRRIGGAPFNFAFHLKRLGVAVRLISRVGDDRNGRRIVDLLTDSGFDAADIQIDPHHPTGTVQVTLDARGVPAFDICSDVAYDQLALDPPAFGDRSGAAMVYFGTLLQRTDDGRRRVHDFLARLGDGCLRFCDINLRPPHVNRRAIADSLNQADLLKLNEEELAAIREQFGGPAPGDAVRWLMERFSVRVVAVTRGSRGSTVTDGRSCVDSPVPDTPAVVDTVGAGDGYAAVLAAGHLRGMAWDQILPLATRFAGRICGIPGAVPEDEAFYDDFRPLLKGTAHGR